MFDSTDPQDGPPESGEGAAPSSGPRRAVPSPRSPSAASSGAGGAADPLTALAGAAQVLGELASVDVATLDDDGLVAYTAGLEAARKRLDAAELTALAELDERSVTDTTVGLVTQNWLAVQAGLPRGRATRQLTVARALSGDLTAARDALAEGRIGFEHAAVLVAACNPRIVEPFVELVPALIEDAQTMTFERWRRHVGELVDLLDQDGSPPPEERTNRLSASRTLDGRVRLDATFDPLEGTYVLQAIDVRADDLFRRYRNDAEHHMAIAVPDRATLRALALAELLRDGLAAGRPPTPAHAAPPPSDPTDLLPDTDCSDPIGPSGRDTGAGTPLGGGEAFAADDEAPSDPDPDPHAGAGADADPRPESGPPSAPMAPWFAPPPAGPGPAPPAGSQSEAATAGRGPAEPVGSGAEPDVDSPAPQPARRRPVRRRTGHAEITLVARVDEPGIVRTPDGVTLHPDAAAHLVCDAAYRSLVVDHTGEPLTLGRERRYATDAQRRALAVRDGGCAFPGCTAPPAWCDAHHIVLFGRPGGDTVPENLVLLCRHHHRISHRRGWSLDRRPDGHLTWTNPWGTELHGQRHGTGRPPPEDAAAEHRAA